MGDLILWATFTGAWLLVAGPLYQGSVELTELEFDREGIQGTAAGLPSAPGRPSGWWWLLPPVMYLLQRRWYNAMRQATLAHLTPVQRRQVTSFESKSVGWFTVAAGATLLASNETWLVTQHYRWPVWLFWLLFIVMLTAAVLNTAALMGRVRSEIKALLSLTEGGSTPELCDSRFSMCLVPWSPSPSHPRLRRRPQRRDRNRAIRPSGWPAPSTRQPA